MSSAENDRLRYLEPDRASVGNATCVGMKIRTATGRSLGRVQGFVINPATRQVKYFVVRPNGFHGPFAALRMLPVTAARVDLDEHTIELLAGDGELTGGSRFQPAQFPAFSDEDLVTAIFAPRA